MLWLAYNGHNYHNIPQYFLRTLLDLFQNAIFSSILLIYLNGWLIRNTTEKPV